MTLALYSQILAVLHQIDQEVRSAAPEPPGVVGQGVIEVAAQRLLRQRLGGLLTRLGRDLMAGGYDERQVAVLLFPLVLYCDEAVLQRIRRDETAQWPLLQLERYRITWGGDRFFELVDAQLEEPSWQLSEVDIAPMEGDARDPGVVLKMLALVLGAGFRGRYLTDEQERTSYQVRLATALSTQAPKDPPFVADEPVQRILPSVPRQALLWLVYGSAVLLALAWPFLLILHSNSGASR